MKRLLLPLVALVVIAAGCDAVGGDDVAATVDGTDITVPQVQDLADALSASSNQPSTSTDDVLDGTEARAALTRWVQLEALSSELHDRGGSVTADDRSQAAQQVKSLKGLSDKNAARYTALLADVIALDRTVGASGGKTPEAPAPTDAEVAAKAAELIASVPPDQLVLTCANAIAGPVAAADQVQALLDGGTDITDTAAFTSLQYGPASNSNPLCVAPSQLPSELQGPFTSTPVGELGRADFASQGDGKIDQTLFFVPTGPRTLTVDDPDVVEAARQQLQQAATESTTQATQAQVAREYRKILRTTDVEVDPRFGRFNVAGSIEAPLAPLVPTTEAPAKAPAPPTNAT